MPIRALYAQQAKDCAIDIQKNLKPYTCALFSLRQMCLPIQNHNRQVVAQINRFTFNEKLSKLSYNLDTEVFVLLNLLASLEKRQKI